jgi:hypothetical protein
LTTVYPNHSWQPTKFATKSRGYWQTTKNQRHFFDKCGESLGVTKFEDWYKFTAAGILPSIISVIEIVLEIYRMQYNLNNYDRTHSADINKLGGQGLLSSYYGGTLYKGNCNTFCDGLLKLLLALPVVYPEYHWDVSRFVHKNKHYWKDPENQRKFFDTLANDLHITNYEDWYQVTRNEVGSKGGWGLLAQHQGSLVKGKLITFGILN